jgi:hypothetical protein
VELLSTEATKSGGLFSLAFLPFALGTQSREVRSSLLLPKTWRVDAGLNRGGSAPSMSRYYEVKIRFNAMHLIGRAFRSTLLD